MSTALEPAKSDLEKIEEFTAVSKLDDNAAILADQLQHEKDQRCEERFLWVFVVTLLVDVIAIVAAGGWTAWLLPFELIFLLAFAKWQGVDWAVVLLEPILDRYLKIWDRHKPE